MNGSHRRGQPGFPNGSARDIGRASYTKNTRHRDRAQKSYKHARECYLTDNERWTKEESSYYSHSTGNLLPIQHADLSGRALDLADARGGKSVLLKDSSILLYRMSFRKLAGSSILRPQVLGTRLETSGTCAMKYLWRYWSEVNDGQGGCYGKRVTAGTRPHTGSRNHELPPPGYYSAFSATPPHEPTEEEDSKAVHDGLTPPHGQSSVGGGHGPGPQMPTGRAGPTHGNG